MAFGDKPKGGRGGAGGFDNIPEIDFNKLKMPPIKGSHFIWIVPLIFLLWLASGLFRVELQEQAVVLLFGKHVKTSGPGLHWNVPSPIGKVIKVRQEEIKRVEIGFRTQRGQMARNVLKKESLMLTEGANMIDIHMSVQYQVSDPVQFLFGVADKARRLVDRGLYETVKNVAEASLREVVGKNKIDNILTVGKGIVQQDIQTQMQEVLDRYGAGITINLVQLQDVHPPEEVRESFRDVNNAEEDKNRLIREAEGYRNSVIPEARGEAAQIIAKSEAYREQRINLTEGDALRFASQLKEYEKAPDITKKRLYIEMMEEVLKQVDKVIIDDNVAKQVLPLLSLGGVNNLNKNKEQ
ncbi:HflK protein [hydrothermal vent metagenome]|uniref:HflK protein n=1 Tax=hydrothermal vent metagenome TaxID=652676 RepID=A0A3B1CYK2_9ZZZZ